MKVLGQEIKEHNSEGLNWNLKVQFNPLIQNQF